MKRALALLMSLAIIISLCPAIVTSANTGTGSSKIDLSGYVTVDANGWVSKMPQPVATSSASYENWQIGIGALIDNNMETRYVGVNEADVNGANPFTPVWIQLDLQKVYIVDKVHLDSYAAGDQGRPSNVDIEVSVDGQTWTKVLDDHDIPLTTVANSVAYDLTFEAKEARYVKLTVNAIAAACDLGNYVCLRAMDVYGVEKQDTPPAKVGEKLDLSSVASTAVSSNLSLEIWGFAVANLLDNNIATMYCGESTGAVVTTFAETWIQVDLQKTYMVDKLSFDSYAAGDQGRPSNVDLEVSVDGITWIKVLDDHNIPLTTVADSTLYELSFGAKEARYVKLTVNAVAAAYDLGQCVCLRGLDVFGYEEEATPPAKVGEKLDLSSVASTAVSSNLSLEMWGFGVANLLDNNIGTLYCGEPTGAGATTFAETWIQVDLQKTYMVDKLSFDSYAAGDQGRPSNVDLEVSVDGITWIKVLDDHNIPLTTVADSTLYELSFGAKEARYVKLTVNAVAGGYDLGNCVCLRGLDVFGYEEEVTPPAKVGEKLDLSSVASTAVSSNLSLEMWGFGVANLLDNNIATLYCGEPTGAGATTFAETWIQVDLQKAYMVDKLSFDSYAAGDQGRPSNVDLEVSVDGITWIKVLDDHDIPLTTVADSTLYELSFGAKEARYVKLTVNAVAGGYDLGNCVCLRGLDVFGYEEEATPPAKVGELLDLSSVASTAVSSNLSLEMWGFGKAQLIDGNKSLGYLGESTGAAAPNFVETWIQIDLQKNYFVDKLVFTAARAGDPSGMPADFVIEVSSDGITWTKAYEKTGNTALADTRDYAFSFEAKEARYVKLTVKSLAGTFDAMGQVLALNEIEVYGYRDEPDDEVPTGDKIQVDVDNVTVSGEFKPTMGKENLFDGTVDTAWGGVDANKAPAKHMDEWFQLDLQQEYTINKIRLANRSDAKPLGGLPSVFDVMVSTDGQTWKVVKSVNGISESDITERHWLTVEFEATTARYVRVRVYNLADIGEAVIGYVVCLREFEVYTDSGKIDLSSFVPAFADGWASGVVQNVATASKSYELWGWGIAGLVDGNVGTNAIFALAPNSDAALPVGGLENVINIDLKAAYKLDALRFASLLANSPNGLPAKFKLEVSLHGTSWTTVLNKTKLTVNDADSDGQWYTFLFDTTESIRYIRLTITDVCADPSEELGYCSALSELELYGVEDPNTSIKPDGWGKISLNTAVLRATNSYNLWGHGTGSLYNGNQTNTWCILTSEEEADYYTRFKDEREFTNECNEFIKIRLDGIYEIDLMRFEAVWAGAGLGVPSDYKLEVSLDGKTWTTALEVTNKAVSDTRWYSDDVAPVQARYLRVTFTKVIDAGDLGFVPHLTELEFYGTLVSKDEVDFDVPAPNPPALPDLSPETGDETNFLLPMMLIVASVLALAVLVFERRKFMR